MASVSFTGEVLKFALIAGIILAFATGFIPVVFLKSIPIWIWIIIIVVILYWMVRK